MSFLFSLSALQFSSAHQHWKHPILKVGKQKPNPLSSMIEKNGALIKARVKGMNCEQNDHAQQHF